MCSVFEIIAFEPVAVISAIYDEITCDLQSRCYQTVLRFRMWLREIFSNSIFPRLMENCEKKCCSACFSSVWDPWIRLLWKGVLKQELTSIEGSTFLRVNNFRNIQAMKLIFFFKLGKIWCRLQKSDRICRKCSPFLTNRVSTCCEKFSHLWREYIRSAVNVLRNRPKISDLSKRDVSELNFLEINWKVG